MSTNVLLSKNYINEVISDYQEIVNQVDEIIKRTGYNGKFIAQKMGLSISTFYQKKRQKSFTFEEIKQLVELIDDDEDDDALEDAYLLELCKECENDEIIPFDDFVDQLHSKYKYPRHES
jgi:predicted transcriptional regulator